MAVFNVSFTTAVNGSESPALTHEDLWVGCHSLATAPEVFTPSYISGCKLESGWESKKTFNRTLVFAHGPQKEIEQEINLDENHKFQCTSLDTGNKVTTTISKGLSEDPYDLYLSLEYNIPQPQAGSDKASEEFRASYTTKAKGNLASGVETMRQLKKEGRLVCK